MHLLGRTCIVVGLILTTLSSFAQKDTLGVPCDITIHKHHYTLKLMPNKGTMVIYGNRDHHGRRHGWWCQTFSPDFPDILAWVGRYRHGISVGTWWDMSGKTVYDRKGKIVKRVYIISDPPF